MKKVLIIEDDEDILEAIQITLEDEGYEIHVATTGERGLAKANNISPHIILLDLFLPEMDGREVAKKIKENNKTKKIPIVLISAHASARHVAKECCVAGFLPKPFTTTALLGTIERNIK